MKLIDFHCDTASELVKDKKCGLLNNNLSVDIQKLKKGESLAQFFAMFVDMKKTDNSFLYCNNMLKNFKQQLEKSSELIGIAKNYEDILQNSKNEIISAILTIEEGGVLKGDLENIDYFYDNGIRLITLTWNYPNEIGFPNYKWKFSDKGLTSFGKAVVEKMNDKRMIIDVSHLSDKGFYDVAEISSLPFVASHSDARAVKNNPRNLTDEMLKVLSDKGGITGINFAAEFLGSNEKGQVSEMVEHIKHIKNVAGIDCIAVGSDFDGISSVPEIENTSQMYKLEDALKKSGFSSDEIEKIFYKNALRVIKDILK